MSGKSNFVEDDICMKYVTDNKQTFERIVLPKCLIGQIMELAHADLGHNGSARDCYTQKIVPLERTGSI